MYSKFKRALELRDWVSTNRKVDSHEASRGNATYEAAMDPLIAKLSRTSTVLGKGDQLLCGEV
jgi:hypothetical protein